MRASADFISVALRLNYLEQKVAAGPAGEGDLATQIATINADLDRIYSSVLWGADDTGLASNPRDVQTVFDGPSIEGSLYQAIYGIDPALQRLPVRYSLGSIRGLYGAIFGGDHRILEASQGGIYGPSVLSVTLGNDPAYPHLDFSVQLMTDGWSLAESVWGSTSAMTTYLAAGRPMLSLVEELQTQIDDLETEIVFLESQIDRLDARIDAMMAG
ncbi:MAG: hypothetical protein ACT6QU_14685 [Aliihoeflea sp.]|uniref:hypothetical protein n=1 Tax=Aliihoeflea sp. TaxID=2608088 RepID=UPI004033705E